MKLLNVVADPYPPFRVDLTVLYAKELPKFDIEIDWIMQSDSCCKHSFVEKYGSGTVYVGNKFKNNTLGGKIKNHFFALIHNFKMFKLIKNNKYDCIQAKDNFFIALVCLVASRVFDIPFVYWLSYPFPESWIYEGKKRMVKYPIIRIVRGYLSQLLLYKIIIPCAKHVFLQSEQMKFDVEKFIKCPSNISVLPMGIADDKVLSKNKCNQNGPADVYRLCFVGIFYKVRHLDFLLRMFKYVLDTFPSAEFVFIGKGEDENEDFRLQNVAKELGIYDQVLFTGFLDFDSMYKMISTSSVCVSSYHPSFILNSTSPTKVIEYMAMCKPVVGNSHPEQELLILQSGCGLCVEYDEQAFADAVVQILKNPILAEEMGSRGHQYVVQNRVYSKIAESVKERLFAVIGK